MSRSFVLSELRRFLFVSQFRLEMACDRCALGLHQGDKRQLAQVNQRERNEEIE
jgi:hypothetical protein